MDPIEFWLILFQIYFHAAICCIHYNLHNIITKNTAFLLSAFLVPLVPLVCLLKGRGNDRFPFTSSIPLIILSASTKCFFSFQGWEALLLLDLKIYTYIYTDTWHFRTLVTLTALSYVFSTSTASSSNSSEQSCTQQWRCRDAGRTVGRSVPLSF